MGYPCLGTPQPGLMGVPKVGYPPLGYPLARSDGGYPPARSNGGYPRWGTPPLGYPLARSDGGYPRWGTPLLGYPPIGVPPSWTWLVYPSPPQVWTDRRMDGWTDTCQNITFPRTTYAVGKNLTKVSSLMELRTLNL